METSGTDAAGRARVELKCRRVTEGELVDREPTSGETAALRRLEGFTE